MTLPTHDHPRPARTTHGAAYWLLVGWYWRPLCWAGRVTLWLVFWPLGLWRSWRAGRRRDHLRARRAR